jgi:cytochrome b561
VPASTYQIITGIVILTIVTIAYGGTFVLRVTRGSLPANDLQKSFFRAGHAHAGVLVMLGLLVLTIEQLNNVRSPYPSFSLGILFAAILMPAGFFLSVVGSNPSRPNRAIVLLWIGAGVLTVGLIGAGVGLILTGMNA